jgi:hypothetical protein
MPNTISTGVAYADPQVSSITYTTVTVASLPTASTALRGMKMFVSDANATTFASTVAGGGSNYVPVYCNGSNWVIG